jgi:vWA-MoxR associated protein C-terminal domain/vWA-MoxR associated protein middle region 0
VTLTTPAVHRTIVVVDVADFSGSSRQDADQLAVRHGMYEVLRTAFAESSINFESCDSEDRGDGALILVPPTVSKSLIADRLPDRLVAALRRYNSTRVPMAQFKLRVALHSGDIRHDGDGWVGRPVIIAFRVLDALEAKTALRDSDQMVAIIATEHFFSEVIQHDPGTVPESYRHITVTVKTYTGSARLRLLGHDTAPRTVAEAGQREQVLDVVPPSELDALHSWLATCEVPRMTMLMSHAAGPSVPLPRRDEVRNAWEAFRYLSEFNAGPDGIPSSVLFLEQLADEIGGDMGTKLLNWVEEHARRMRLGRALERHRHNRTPVAQEPHLYLTIMLEPDAIDPGRCVLSYWRQDDPMTWPPTRGGVCEVGLDELEYRVDDVILDAEGVWADQNVSAAVEFLLPRTLLNLPVQRWRKEHASGQPRPLHFDYRVSIRSLERMRTKHWHRAWNVRWDSMLEQPSPNRLHFSGSAASREHPLEAVLSDPRWVGLVMAKPPSPQPEPGSEPDELVSALRNGLPVIFWHPEAGSEDLRELVTWALAGESGFLDLLARRKAVNSFTTGPVNDSLVHDLVVMWDDPKRVIVLDQP